jgi:hypothetical protein
LSSSLPSASFRVPDEDGDVLTGELIVKDGPSRLLTALPLDEIVATLKRNGHERVGTSEDAGRFLCNYLYYSSLFACNRRAQQLCSRGTDGVEVGAGTSAGGVEVVAGTGAGGEAEVGKRAGGGVRGEARAGGGVRGEARAGGGVRGEARAGDGKEETAVFVHVPSFAVVSKEAQLLLLVEIVTAVADSIRQEWEVKLKEGD